MHLSHGMCGTLCIVRKLNRFFVHVYYKKKVSVFCSYKCHPQARIQRGDTGSGTPPPPPWDLSELGSCVEALWVGEGVQRLFLPYYYQFFSARFARQWYTYILRVHVYTYYKLNVQYGTVILSLYFPYPNYDKNPTSNPLLLGIFIFFLSRITRFYAWKISGGGPPHPPIPNIFRISNLPCHLCLCVERDLPCPNPLPPQKKNLCANNCLENWFKPLFCKKEKSNNPPFFSLFLFFFFFFFFACQNFRKVGPPWRKFLDPRLIHIYRRINRKFLNNIAIFPKCNINVYFNILSLKITATALHVFAVNIHNDRRGCSED